MQVFLMHVGHNNVIDIGDTVTRRRQFSELTSKLPADAPELGYFATDPDLHASFPSGSFNCWGVPSGAEPSFEKTQPGDLVLMVPFMGLQGGVRQLGVVKAKCPLRCYQASRLLWPNTPDSRLFPLIFFFDTEIGLRGWFDFLDDVGIKSNWEPRGWYRRVASKRFDRFGGPTGYLEFLRKNASFKPIGALP